MEFNNVLYFLINDTSERCQKILKDYAADLIGSGCFDKHTLSLYCGETCSRVWIDEEVKQFETIEFYDELVELLVEKFTVTRMVALELVKVAIEETKTNSHTQIVLLKSLGG